MLFLVASFCRQRNVLKTSQGSDVVHTVYLWRNVTNTTNHIFPNPCFSGHQISERRTTSIKRNRKIIYSGFNQTVVNFQLGRSIRRNGNSCNTIFFTMSNKIFKFWPECWLPPEKRTLVNP